MRTRLQLIGEIRDRIEELYEAGRFAFVREIMGDIDRFNFSGVDDLTVLRIHTALHYDPSREWRDE